MVSDNTHGESLQSFSGSYVYSWFETYLMTDHYTVIWASAYCTVFTITNGITQGGLILALLYNVYTNELSHELKGSEVGRHIDGDCVNHSRYVDEIAALTLFAKSLQNLLHICFRFSEDREILFNSMKIATMQIWPRKHNGTITSVFTLGEVPLESAAQVKYPGHLNCLNMKDDSDITRKLKRLNTVGIVLVRKFYSINIKDKKELFRTFCTIFYCRTLWMTYTVECVRKIRLCHNDLQ